MAGIKGKSPRSNYTCRFLAFLQLLLSSNSFASLIPFFVAHAEQENGSPWRCNLPCYGYGIMHGYKPLCNGAAEFVTCGAGGGLVHGQGRKLRICNGFMSAVTSSKEVEKHKISSHTAICYA